MSNQRIDPAAAAQAAFLSEIAAAYATGLGILSRIQAGERFYNGLSSERREVTDQIRQDASRRVMTARAILRRDGALLNIKGRNGLI